MNKKCIMIQGTGSSVGKSLLVTALCRILKQDGYRVAPFKSQNMALNSYITSEGLEMGRAQVAQAEACGILPSVLMNPVLLKPTGERKSQVIINGRVYGSMSAVEYHEFKPRLKEMIAETYRELEHQNDVVIIEGAGSPAEINLRENDIVNMGMAELVDAPVLLVGDIDKGGVFASLVGTMLLLQEQEKSRVKGVIINKFRGDVEILKPGLRMLEDIIHIPVIGVVPYTDVHVDEEDSITQEFHQGAGYERGEIHIEVIRLPYISNFTDFKVLRNFSDVSLRYVGPGETLDNPDIVILPGSKNTLGDLEYLRSSGLEAAITRHHRQGKMIVGICGGYQMLGKKISDPCAAESHIKEMEGLGFLDMETVFDKDKTTAQVKAKVVSSLFSGEDWMGQEVEGYEIHMGKTFYGREVVPWLHKVGVEDSCESGRVGVSNLRGNVLGTYIHGIFDNTTFTRKLLNEGRKRKGLLPLHEVPLSFREFKEQEYDRLAQQVRSSLDMNFIYRLLEKCGKEGE